MRNPIIRLISLLGFCLATQPSIAGSDCPVGPLPAGVSVNVEMGKVSVDHTLDRNGLKRVKGEIGGKVPTGRWHLLGLTVADFKFTMRVNVKYLPLSGKRYCVVLHAVDVSVGYPAGFAVYIDRKFRRDGCEYRSVQKHENTHVDIFRDNMKLYATRLKKELEAAVRRLKPVYAYSPDQGAEKVKAQLKRGTDRVTEEMHRTVNAENTRFDARESNTSIQGLCRNRS